MVPVTRQSTTPANYFSRVDKITIASDPDGADIEIDGNFMGNAPSTLELAPGEHTIVVRKAGYEDWEKKLKVTGGEIRVNAQLQKVTPGQGVTSGN